VNLAESVTGWYSRGHVPRVQTRREEGCVSSFLAPVVPVVPVAPVVP